MFDVVVKAEKGGVDKIHCDTSECTIGKARDNLVQLKGWSVGGIHAQLRQDNEGIYVSDMGSNNGTTVNDEFIEEEYGPLRSSDVIGVGNYQIKVGWLDDSHKEEAVEEAAPKKAKRKRSPMATESVKTMIGVRPHSSVKSDETIIREARFLWRNKVHSELLKLMDLRRVDVGSMSEEDLRAYQQDHQGAQG